MNFKKFDVRHVQYRLLRLPALRTQKSLGLQHLSQRPGGEQPGLRLEGDRLDLGVHLAPRAGLDALRFMAQAELDDRNPGRRVPQRLQLGDHA